VRKFSGGCFCGAVRYEAESAPSTSMVCHCQTCRRVAAAPVVAWVTFEKSQFKFIKGQPRVLSSSPSVRRAFCPDCGTALTYEIQKSPTIIDVTTCSLDEPAAFPPTYHAWLSHNIDWVKFSDNLPEFPESKA
jgi:hypothetical protein